MKKVDFTNSSLDGIPEINLSGNVEFYDGSYIANRILDSGKKHIRLRINCFGGNILGGYEIIAAQNQFTQDGGIIETWGLGVTDSVAGWLLANGTKGYRKVMPYNTMLLHLPATKDGLNANDLPDGELKDRLLEATENIANIFVIIIGMFSPKAEIPDDRPYHLVGTHAHPAGRFSTGYQSTFYGPAIPNLESLGTLTLRY